jgi:enamine deaminase RidA (YjgF/YER057c/UK114 family)
VECNGLLIVSIGTRPGGSDTIRQVEAVYGWIGELLAAGGATPSDVVRTIDYITPDALNSYRGAAGARKALFGDSSPAGTAVVVERLLDPNTLLHVTAIAVVGDGPRRIYSPGWPRDGRFLGSPGAGKGKLVCLEGMTGADPETGAVTEGDVAVQTRVAYEKAAAILSAAGLSMGHVVKTVDYIAPTALESYRATADVRRGFFESGYPVATGVVVNRLLRPELLIEVDFTAMTD